MTKHDVQWLDELGAEFARVAAEREQSARDSWAARSRRAFGLSGARRTVVAAVSAFAFLASAAYAVPVTRAAIDDLTDAFAGWIAGNDADAPGQAVRPGDDAPEWVSTEQGRVIAEAQGVKLFVSRAESEAGPLLRFTLGNGVAQFDTPEGWAKRFENHAVVVLGRSLMPAADSRRAPLLGVTARSVASVELRYADGAPDVSDTGDGGFVLIADATRRWRELVAHDEAGRELERVDVSAFGPSAAESTR
jgi:hypothetical protein